MAQRLVNSWMRKKSRSLYIAKLINIDPNIGKYYPNLKKYKRRG